MRLVDGRVVYAASDLNDYLACPHRVALRRDALAHGIEPPDEDPTLLIVARKGEIHERSMLERFAGQGLKVTAIPDDGGSPPLLERAVTLTRAAMQRGDAVIYQAAFLDQGWSGRADFLLRVDTPSDLGAWSYEVADTKLALREKPAFIVQLCLYAEFVGAIQGRLPVRVRALLGDGGESVYDPARFLPYVRGAKARFSESMPLLDAAAIPDRIGACAQCAWSARCEDVRRGVDHLAQVASIRRDQIKKLAGGAITTLAALARTADADAPPGLGSFLKLRRQARLQLHQRETGRLTFELLEPRPRAGFALLPRPDEHDVYFDMEGDPLYEAGRGLEYLFGAYVRGTGYHRFWGENRSDEKTAFVAFMEWLVAHRKSYPNAHVYHYAPYERTALRRLAMEHATHEDDVDDLLRDGILVDLYAVVRGALAQSQDGYSIKKLEPFYGFERGTQVRKGDQSIVAFEEYLLDRDEAKRDDIIRYNAEDCFSTEQLHAWLLSLRPEESPWRGEDVEPEMRAEREDEARRRRLEEALRDGAQPGEPRVLAAHLLAYHRREDKPAYWTFYDLTEGDVDFEEHHDALGGLVLSTDPSEAPFKAQGVQNLIYTYHFPPQRQKFDRRNACDPATGKSPGRIFSFDEDRRVVQIALAKNARHPRALIPGRPLRKDAQVQALERFASAVLEGSAAQRYSAAWDILRKAAPRITGLVEGALVQPAHRTGAEAIDPADIADLVLRLDGSALVVQGPPGTGKTYAGAHVVAALLAAKKRVGISATGHKAIHNLLREVEAVVAASGRSFRGVKKFDGNDEETRFVSARGFVDNAAANEAFGEYELVAGTAWLFAREDLEPVDVLIVDEAGQVALADVIAMATNARSVVLLGDPLQLAHVSQGTHPEGVGASVLTHLVGEDAEHGTIAPDRGVFLDRTFRMHPALANFVSSMLYGGRLAAMSQCARQRIDAPWFSGAGLRYVPVAHDGNAQCSEEEAGTVAEIVAGLLGGTFTDVRGQTRALTIDDILIVAPYNLHVRLLGRRLRARFGPNVRVGTVDKFQGQEAPAVIYSLAASSAEDAPRGPAFLFEENRFNVAISRGRALAVVVCSPRLLETPCPDVDLLRAVAAFCGFAEAARSF